MLRSELVFIPGSPRSAPTLPSPISNVLLERLCCAMCCMGAVPEGVLSPLPCQPICAVLVGACYLPGFDSSVKQPTNVKVIGQEGHPPSREVVALC